MKILALLLCLTLVTPIAWSQHPPPEKKAQTALDKASIQAREVASRLVFLTAVLYDQIVPAAIDGRHGDFKKKFSELPEVAIEIALCLNGLLHSWSVMKAVERDQATFLMRIQRMLRHLQSGAPAPLTPNHWTLKPYFRMYQSLGSLHRGFRNHAFHWAMGTASSSAISLPVGIGLVTSRRHIWIENELISDREALASREQEYVQAAWNLELDQFVIRFLKSLAIQDPGAVAKAKEAIRNRLDAKIAENVQSGWDAMTGKRHQWFDEGETAGNQPNPFAFDVVKILLDLEIIEENEAALAYILMELEEYEAQDLIPIELKYSGDREVEEILYVQNVIDGYVMGLKTFQEEYKPKLPRYYQSRLRQTIYVGESMLRKLELLEDDRIPGAKPGTPEWEPFEKKEK